MAVLTAKISEIAKALGKSRQAIVVAAKLGYRPEQLWPERYAA